LIRLSLGKLADFGTTGARAPVSANAGPRLPGAGPGC
jgi:hypothetical protein